ncbi:F-box protein CPR1-like [Silene latifolia]|uniref:F-box protein CPR1-like n=1 Tax=Silene latifolia TaxID=37657 RepID=UPI003D777A32
MASKETTNNASTYSTKLPSELIVEIFSYLPIETLKGLITYPPFARALKTLAFQRNHAFNLLNNPNTKQLILIPSWKSYEHAILEINPNVAITDQTTQFYILKQLFNDVLPFETKTFSNCMIIGGTNGLICLYFEFYRLPDKPKNPNSCYCCAQRAARQTFHYLILWNPCTREHHALPNAPQGFNFDRKVSTTTLCGFGYDAINSTYKFVLCNSSNTQFYDLSSNNWNVIETPSIIDWSEVGLFKDDYHLGLCTVQFGQYVNGALNWIMSREKIVSIDLSTGVSNCLNIAKCCTSPNNHRINLGVLKGRLSLCCSRKTSYKVSIWVMKEYGNDESWTNISTVCWETKNLAYRPGEVVIRPPVWMSDENSEREVFLFLVDGKIASWLPKVKKFGFVKGPEFNCTRSIVHVDTFVSPKPQQVLTPK